MLKTITAFILVAFLPNVIVKAQHNQWVEPIYLQMTDDYAPTNWDYSRIDKFLPFAVDNQKSTYFAGDYESGILWFGTKFSAIERPTNYPVLYIAKIDSSGEPQWLKEISNYTKYNGTQLLCISRIKKIEYDPISNKLLYNFNSCTIDTLDSFPYEMKKDYIGTLNCESGELESLNEVPGNFLFYKTPNELITLDYRKQSETINGVYYGKGGYLNYFNNAGILQNSVRIIKPVSDSISSDTYKYNVGIRDIQGTPDGGTIITGAKHYEINESTLIGSTLIDTSASPTLFIIKLNAQGQTVWEKLYHASNIKTN